MSNLSGGKSIATKPKVREVEKFFSVVVDNFFSDPISVKNYGKSLRLKEKFRQQLARNKTSILI